MPETIWCQQRLWKPPNCFLSLVVNRGFHFKVRRNWPGLWEAYTQMDRAIFPVVFLQVRIAWTDSCIVESYISHKNNSYTKPVEMRFHRVPVRRAAWLFPRALSESGFYSQRAALGAVYSREPAWASNTPVKYVSCSFEAIPGLLLIFDSVYWWRYYLEQVPLGFPESCRPFQENLRGSTFQLRWKLLSDRVRNFLITGANLTQVIT